MQGQAFRSSDIIPAEKQRCRSVSVRGGGCGCCDGVGVGVGVDLGCGHPGCWRGHGCVAVGVDVGVVGVVGVGGDENGGGGGPCSHHAMVCRHARPQINRNDIWQRLVNLVALLLHLLDGQIGCRLGLDARYARLS